VSVQLGEGGKERIRRWGAWVGFRLRRRGTRLKLAWWSWRRWRAAGQNRHTPLRVFAYLDEVSVYSLIASRLGAIAAEFTNTQTESLQNQSGISGRLGTTGVASAGADTRQISTNSQQSQVVRRSMIQTTFREFREYEKERFAISLPEDKSDETPSEAMPNIVSWDDVLGNEEVLKKHHLILDEEKLDRGALVEVKVVLETHASFQASAVFEAIAGMIAEKPDLFGTSADEMEGAMFFKRIVDRLLAGLIPLRGVVADCAVVTLSGRRLIVHRDVYEKLATVGLDGGGRVQPVQLHVVGVAEEALFWKDIRRVLFSQAEFFALCRVSRPGLQEERSWSPMKLAQVIGSVAPEVEKDINELSLESMFNRNGTEHRARDEDLAARRALMEYATSLLDDNGRSLRATDLGELDAVIYERLKQFGTVEQKYSGFKAIEEHLANRFREMEINGEEEHGRRETALASAGLTYLDDGLPSEVVESNGEVALGERALILDTEFIAIYW
jgi:hypothetical protein